ncbi:MAG: O-antigen ligase family protein [Erythrobacter sp.]
MLTAVAFGGGGSRFGLANLAVQVVALIVLAICAQDSWRFWKEAPLALRALVGVSLLLPLLQLVPLPETVWSALAGRDLITLAAPAVGIESAGARPLSLFPLRTALAATALITPLAVLMICWALPRQHLLSLGWLWVATMPIMLAIGMVQLSTNGAVFQFWPEGLWLDALVGTFANRNSTGLFLVGVLGLALMLPPPRRLPIPALLAARAALAALIVTGIVLTKSRSALVLTAIPLVLGLVHAVLIVWNARTERQSPFVSAVIAATLAGTALIGITAIVMEAPGRLAQTLARFDSAEDDSRQFIWEDAVYSASRYWPVGAGMGTFDDVFQVDEALENVSIRRAGRAHNDYLEIAIEAGAFGLGLIALWLAYLGWLTWQARRSPDRWAAWAASGLLFAIALQSFTDYPLRNQTMLAMAAFALALLARIATEPRRQRA